MSEDRRNLMLHLIQHRDRRDWSQLPADFEAGAVKAAFQDIRKHFGKLDIRERIKASKATTFAELMESIQ